MLRRFFAFIGVGALLIAGRLSGSLINYSQNGGYSCFASGDRQVRSSELVFPRGYERLDFEGGEDACRSFIESLRAEIISKESVSGVTVYYCYSPNLTRSVYLFGRKVNLMVAVSEDRVSAGSPILKGSY